jgi:hypothetical protein
LSIAWDKDGKRLAVTHGADVVQLWDKSAESMRPLRQERAAFNQATFNHDGTRVAAADRNGYPVLFNVASPDEPIVLEPKAGFARVFVSMMFGGPERSIGTSHVAFSHDDKRLVSAHRSNILNVWDLQKKDIHRSFSLPSTPQALACSPKEQIVAVAGWFSGVRVYNYESGQLITTLQHPQGTIQSLVFSPDGKRICATTSDLVWTWTLPSPEPELRLVSGFSARCVTFSPDGRRIAAINWNGTQLKLWDSLSGQELLNLTHHSGDNYNYYSSDDAGATPLAWSPDGKTLAAEAPSGVVALWGEDRTLTIEKPPEYSGPLSPANLVKAGSHWSYLDDGTDQGTAWREAKFDDANWKTGKAQFGYGDGDESTLVEYGSNPSRKHLTTYFRKSFEVADPAQVTDLVLGLIRDDGAAVYLNGQEIARDNLAADAKFNTRANSTTNSPQREAEVEMFGVDPKLLVKGRNVIAVEIHQGNRTSSDLSFDAYLYANAIPALVKALKHEDYQKRIDAAQVLRRLGPYAKSAGPEIAAAIKVRGQFYVSVLMMELAEALGRVQTPVDVALPALVDLAGRHEFTEFPAAAARGLGYYADQSPAAVETLIGLLGHKERRVQNEAVRALVASAGRSPEILAALVPKLVNGPAQLREGACRALAKAPLDPAQHASIAAAVAPLLDDKTPEVKAWAAAVMARVEPSRDVTIDLLKLLSYEPDSMNPSWRIEKGYLYRTTSNIRANDLFFPVRLPQEYELTLMVQPMETNNGLRIGVTSGDRSGVVLVDYRNRSSGLENIDGKNRVENKTEVTGPLLTIGQRATIRCAVRRQGVQVAVNDKTVIDWQGDVSRLSKPTNWGTIDSPFPYVGGDNTVYRIHQVTFKPLD